MVTPLAWMASIGMSNGRVWHTLYTSLFHLLYVAESYKHIFIYMIIVAPPSVVELVGVSLSFTLGKILSVFCFIRESVSFLLTSHPASRLYVAILLAHFIQHHTSSPIHAIHGTRTTPWWTDNEKVFSWSKTVVVFARNETRTVQIFARLYHLSRDIFPIPHTHTHTRIYILKSIYKQRHRVVVFDFYHADFISDKNHSTQPIAPQLCVWQ